MYAPQFEKGIEFKQRGTVREKIGNPVLEIRGTIRQKDRHLNAHYHFIYMDRLYS